jgi:CheY-like chemotaxis protein
VDDRVARAHAMMERQVNHLVRLVDDLLEMSRVSRGTFSLKKARVDLASIVRSAIETSQPLIDAAGHRLSVDLPAEPITLDGDAVRIAQVLSNLLNNAAKYTDDGGRISVEARTTGDVAEIRVIDDGVGIPPEVMPRIFQMFARGELASARGQGGLGVGLALARRLAEMHGGTLEARSEGRGEGSELTLRIPLAASLAGDDSPPDSTDAAIAGKRVLVVDDNEDSADTLGMLLELLGAEVRVAHDGAEGLATFQESDPDVVLLDIGMPGMNGYEVARAIRQRFGEHRAVLVALTGWGQEQDRRDAREAGFNHHMVKPVEIGALRRLLASVQGRERAG